jgi:vancomycin resistance protein VanJ
MPPVPEIDSPAPPADRIPQRRWRRAVTYACLGMALTGLVIRLTVRDRFLIGNTIYYATPWSVLCVLMLVAARGLRNAPRQRQIRTGLRVLALACAVAWAATAWSVTPTSSHPGALRIVTWNLAHGRWGLKGLAAAVAELKPDIAILVEADPSRMDVRAIFHEAFPEYHVAILGSGIVVVSRWPGGEARAYQMGGEKAESRIREIDLATPWGSWTVFACDMASNTLYQREPHFSELAARIGQRTNPVIVAGDFNTPLDSIQFDQFRKLGLKESFETAGSGYLPTWPVPCPVLSLDQIWVSSALRPVCCVREWNWRTDHAASVATVMVPEDQSN